MQAVNLRYYVLLLFSFFSFLSSFERAFASVILAQDDALQPTISSSVDSAGDSAGDSVGDSAVENPEDGSDSIEDATLDGSGTAAAKAANEAGTEAGKQTENKPASSEGSKDLAPESPDAPTDATASEQTSEAEKPVTAESVTKSEVGPSDEDSSKISETSIKGRYGGRIFGKYKVQLAANRPTFNEGQKCYEKLYGKSPTYFSASGDWFPLDWWVNPGLMMRMGMYSVRGKAATGKLPTGAIDCDALTVDNNSPTSLLFIPIQVGPKLQFSPFRQKWLVADVWVAGEYGWWQETRDNEAADLRSILPMATDRVYTNTGRKRAVSTGVSAHILLNALDERSVRSMIDSMGLGYVYLTGFMETVKSSSKDGLTFGRNVMGIGFTFESFK
jgi:hypothetical protein